MKAYRKAAESVNCSSGECVGLLWVEKMRIEWVVIEMVGVGRMWSEMMLARERNARWLEEMAYSRNC